MIKDSKGEVRVYLSLFFVVDFWRDLENVPDINEG